MIFLVFYNVDVKCFGNVKKYGEESIKIMFRVKWNLMIFYLSFKRLCSQYQKYYSFTSKKLHMYSIVSKKKALSSNDDKRILRNDSFDTYAIGHYKTL